MITGFRWSLEGAANYFGVDVGSVTDDQIAEVRSQYEYDWMNWPAPWGAPYEDVDSDGSYDPTVDIPGEPGSDQTMWIIANDVPEIVDENGNSIGYQSTAPNLYGADPIGVELQITLWAYNFGTDKPLGNMVFKRSRLKYTGLPNSPENSVIDTMYFAQWSDPDLGDYMDDFVGSDIDLSLGYVYNGNVLDGVFDGVHDLSKNILNSKKPMIIFGESFLRLNSAEFLYNKILEFLHQNNKFSEEWNPVNILSCDASTVGNFDLGLINRENNLLNELKSNKFDIVYLVGQDNIDFNKKDEFIIYQGSHGDKGAESADIILPGAAYTEQNGHFTNLEGKIQKAYKASYPPGEAKEDWQIINELAEYMNNRKLFNDKEELESSMFNYLNLQKEKKSIKLNNSSKEFNNQKITINVKDYYFSNIIARSSKTMVECNSSKVKLKSTGTEG
mgnify:CR=1 FL=1